MRTVDASLRSLLRPPCNGRMRYTTYTDIVVACSITCIARDPHVEKVEIRPHKGEGGVDRCSEVKRWGEAPIVNFIRDEGMKCPLRRYNVMWIPHCRIA